MTNSPTSCVTEAQEESPNKARAEAELRALQDKHRLAIHVWEVYENNRYQEPSLASCHKEMITNIQERKLSSMTLLPAPSSGKSVLLWKVNPGARSRPAYLFSLDQDIPHPAKVVRVFPKNLDSGRSDDKKLCLENHSKFNELDCLYEPFQSDHEVLAYSLSDKGRAFSTAQMDALGSFYTLDKTTPAPPAWENVYREANGTFQHNEMLVAASKQHCVAIAIPWFPNEDRETSSFALLHGVLLGIEQLNKGVDIPVVIYHCTGQHLGTCTYVGQGRKELTEQALKAIEAIQKAPFGNDAEYSMLREMTSKILGVKLWQNLSEQSQAIAELRRQATAEEGKVR